MNCRFPQLSECPHRHYTRVFLTSLGVDSLEERTSDLFFLKIHSNVAKWTILRSRQDFRRLDDLLHTCVISRAFSQMPLIENLEEYVGKLNGLLCGQLSRLKCLSVLNWFESDSKGYHWLPDCELNSRAIGAAFVIRAFGAPPDDERQYLSLCLGEMVSIVRNQGFWTKGKKGLQIGFFPSNCVQLIGESTPMAPLVVRRRTIFPNLFNRFSSSAPELKQRLHLKEILRQKVFGSDLSEQLFPDKHLPEVVRVCSAFVERNAISFSGIYRLSGVSSNISRLRATFDSGETPDLESDDQVMADVHCVSSLLKLYFRLLPNPLMTFESYDDFVRLFRDDSLDDSRRLSQMRRLCRRLPPPHFRTLRALVFHLRKVSFSAQNTGMTAKNLSIVWAPNLLRSPEIESRSLSGDLAALQVIGIQAVLTEYLIQNCDHIFDDTIIDNDDSPASTQLTIPEKNSKIGSFGRHMSEREIRRQTESCVVRQKSFESYFSRNDIFLSDFRLNFAKIQTLVNLIRVLPKFEPNLRSLIRPTVWTTAPPLMSHPLVTTEVTTGESVVVSLADVRNDAIVVKQNNSRERIERIKALRRQEISQKFSQKPIPFPRKSRQKESSDTRWTPVPTPRRRDSPQEIRILTTSAKTKRNNWNENAIQLLNKKEFY